MYINTNFRSANFSKREGEIQYIILHYTAMEFQDALLKLTEACDVGAVSCHYLIKRSGEIFQLVEDRYKAWHAGISYWRGLDNLNNHSIGIELDNSGFETFPSEQISSATALCKQLISTYNIPPGNILGHSDIAPNRKIDPGYFFDWTQLAAHGLGIWYRPLNRAAAEILDFFEYGDTGEKILVMQQNLLKFGYKIDLTSKFDDQTNFVVRAFLSHFRPEIIENHGIDYYRNDDARYVWDEVSGKILDELILNL